MTDQRDEYQGRHFDEQNRRFRAQETAAKKGTAEEGGGITEEGRYTSAYYQRRALLKHPEPISDEWIEQVVARPERIAINQVNDTISYWAYISEFGNSIRVILRERDGTLVNRFPDSQEAKRRLRRRILP